MSQFRTALLILIVLSLLSRGSSSLVVQGDGRHVLIIEETGERHKMARSQLPILTSIDVRKAVREGGFELRIWDQDIDATRNSKWFQAALKLPRESLPWVVISNGKKSESSPLPADVAGMIQLIESYK